MKIFANIRKIGVAPQKSTSLMEDHLGHWLVKFDKELRYTGLKRLLKNCPHAHTHTHTHTHVKKNKDSNPIQMEVKRTAWGGPVSAACLKSAQDHNM